MSCVHCRCVPGLRHACQPCATCAAPGFTRLRELRDLPARIPELRRQAVEELLAQGWSRQQIAAELGISRQSVYEWTAEKSKI